ncbi:copper resistance protein NlpE N-terminal domain-containing protein [Ferruginibacter sp. HRS2-29]|uniref:copper resistance protein NlpE N-terminal domain-containing protein n=1 Tax=Ferruginibacter sp. HRS2-29 TaxID=2487334 RepID=UPI0020CBCF99|nr:copper resistance protein NlpE N-terminal domain-containing protein [Ferruginibacter sp. HRS2-29]MCP9750287.1 hypothetical protein [Ferruginibacter sp. HRS2-29]
MKLMTVIIAGVVLCMSSCGESATKSESTNKDSVTTMKSASDSNVIAAAVDTTTAAKPANLTGTYKTSYPEGYDSYEIMLHSDSTYMYTAKYHGDKARTVKLSGKFTFTTPGTITLGNAKNEPADYLVKENELIQVNKDPKSEVVITLTKEK